jgi:hypothetical protein
MQQQQQQHQQVASDPPPIAPHMSAHEADAFRRLLDAVPAGGAYLEFGCGGSTYEACLRPNVASVRAVESDAAWISKLTEHGTVRSAVRDGRLRFRHVDVNAAPGAWGYPADESKKGAWSAYSRAALDAGLSPPPALVFVDGRFRVACALRAAERAAAAADPVPIVAIHDFNDRPQYHGILPFFDVLQSVETLVVLRQKAGADLGALRQMADAYELVTA